MKSGKYFYILFLSLCLLFSGYLAYLPKVWISDKTYWQTTKQSVYNWKQRTNNDPEGTQNQWKIRGEVHNMTIYKRSEFLFKEQEQLLLTKDLGSYGNLDTGD